MNVNYVHQIACNVQITTCVYNVKMDISYLMDFVDNAIRDVRNALIQPVKSANISK